MSRTTEQDKNRGTNQLPNDQSVVVRCKADVDLYLTSDWHAGSLWCDYTGLAQMVKDVKNNKFAKMIIGGDLTECTPPGHHDGGRDSDSDIDKQIIRTARGLKPIRDKIVLMYAGNHGGARTIAKSGMDPDLLISEILDVPYKVVPSVVQFQSRKGNVRVCGGHGKSTAKNHLLELERLWKVYPNCQLYHLGHDHSLTAEQAGALEYDECGAEHW